MSVFKVFTYKRIPLNSSTKNFMFHSSFFPLSVSQSISINQQLRQVSRNNFAIGNYYNTVLESPITLYPTMSIIAFR